MEEFRQDCSLVFYYFLAAEFDLRFGNQHRNGGIFMKITVYNEDKNHLTIIEVSDEECEIWVENDYSQRLSAAEDKSSVQKRTPQQIMDEECNKPTFNNNQTETRRHVSMNALDPDERYIADAADIQSDLFADDYTELYRAIEKLKPRQKELIYRVFWDGLKQAEVAKAEGVTEAAISGRMERIYKKLRKFLKFEKNL